MATLLILSIVLPCRAATGQTNPLQYLPLQTGNEWHMAYVLESPSAPPDTLVSASFAVIDTATVQGTRYFILSRGLVDSDTVRVEPSGKVLGIDNSVERVLFDFGAADGSRYTYPFLDSLEYDVLVRSNTSADTFVGEFSSCMSFFFDVPDIVDEELSYTFCPEIGLTRIGGAWVFGTLIEAVVGENSWILSEGSKPSDSQPELQAFPNPASETVHFSLADAAVAGEPRGLTVYNAAGSRVAEITSISQRQAAIHVDVSNWPAGTYFAVLSVSDNGRILATASFSIVR